MIARKYFAWRDLKYQRERRIAISNFHGGVRQSICLREILFCRMRTGENVAITKIYFAASAFRVGRVNVAPYIFSRTHVDVSRIRVHLHLVAHNTHVYSRITRGVCTRICIYGHAMPWCACVRAHLLVHACVGTGIHGHDFQLLRFIEYQRRWRIGTSYLSLSLSLSLSISHTVGEIVSNRNEFSVNDREDSRMKSSVTRALVRLSSFTAIIDKRVSIFQSTLAQRARPDLIVLIDLTWRDTRLYLVLAARISTNESLPFEFRIEDSSNHVRNVCNWDGALLSNDRARRNVLAWDVLLLWRLRTTGTSRGSFLLKARLGLYDRESRSKPLRALWKLLAATRCFAVPL